MAKKDEYVLVETAIDKKTNSTISKAHYSFSTRELAEKCRDQFLEDEDGYHNDAKGYYKTFEIFESTLYETASDVPWMNDGKTTLKDLEVLAELKAELAKGESKPKKDKPIQLVQFREEDSVFSMDAHYKCEPKPVSNFKSGAYVYMRDGRLGVVEAKDSGYFSVHTHGLEHWVGKDTIVYPVTLGTSYVAEKITELRDKYYRLNIMNATFSRELEKTLDSAMQIYNDLNSEDGDSLAAKSAWEGLWEMEEKRLKELEIHANALHIMPKR